MLNINNNLFRESEIYRMIEHISSNGSSHSFINQNVTDTASPTFGNTVLTGSIFTNNSVITKGYILSVLTETSGDAFLISNGIGYLLTDNTTIEISSNTLSIKSGIAGNGLTGGSGLPLSVLTDNNSIEILGDQIRISSGITGNGIIGGSGVPFSVLTDNNSIEIFNNQLRIASGIIGNGLTGGSGIPISVLTDNNSVELFGNQLRVSSGITGNGLTGGSGIPISVLTDNNSVEIFGNQLRVSSGIIGNGIVGGSGLPLSVLTDNNSIEIFENQIRVSSGITGNGIVGGSGLPLSVLTNNNSIEIFGNQLRVASGAAGNGLTGGSGSDLSVLTDSTLEILSNQLRVSSGLIGSGLTGGSGIPISVLTNNVSIELFNNQLRVASGAAGDGLIGGGGTAISIGQGTGIDISGNVSTNISNPIITTVGTLNNLEVTGTGNIVSNLVVSGNMTITGNLIGNGINIISEALEYESIAGGINVLTRNSKRYYANTVEEVNVLLSSSISGDTIYLGPYEYLIRGTTNTFIVPDGVNITGYKNLTKIKRESTNTNIRLYRLSGNSVISNQIIDCNNRGNTLAPGEGVDNKYATIYLEGTRGITIRDTKIENIGSKSLFIYTENTTSPTPNGIYNLTLERIEIRGVQLGTSFIEADKGNIYDLKVIKSDLGDYNGQQMIEGSTNFIGNIEIIDNKLSNSSYNIVMTNGADDRCRFEGNKGKNCVIAIGSGKDVKIKNNKLSGNSLGYIISSFANNVIITDNILTGQESYILATDINNLLIKGNEIRPQGTASFSIAIFNSNLDCGIISNKIESGSQGATYNSIYERYGPVVTPDPVIDSKIYIKDNNITETRTNPTRINGFSNKYNITITGNTNCTLENLSRFCNGHQIEINIINITGGTTLSLTPERFISGTRIDFIETGGRVILEWKMEEWEIKYISGGVKLITNDIPVGITNIDSIISTNNEAVMIMGTRNYKSNYIIRPNTTATKTTFSFGMPRLSLSSNNSVIGYTSGYSGSEGLNNLYIRGNVTSGNVYCSFTSTGDSRNTDHIIQVVCNY